MFKKKLLTLACAVFCAAIVTAQTKGSAPVSAAKEATANLIDDGAIDSLPFGNEDGKSIVFGQYKTNNGVIELGWGSALSDTLWLSIYDGYWMNGTSGKTDSVEKVYGTNDNVNVEYVDERPRQLSSIQNSLSVDNTFAVGVAINDKFGVQAVWDANWVNREDVASTFSAVSRDLGGGTTVSAYSISGWNDSTHTNETTTISYDSVNSSSGYKRSYKYDNIKNFKRSNTITFNFKGAGIEDVGDIAFYAKLNKIYSDLNFATRANDYSDTEKYLGTKLETISATGINQKIEINPGLEIEAGFNLPELGVMQSKLSFTDDFKMNFDVVENNASYTTESNNYDSGKRVTTTKVQEYEYTPGNKLYWKNTLTPAYTMDFNLVDQLTLKAAVSAAVAFGMDNQEAGTATVTSSTKVKDYSTGKTTTNIKETVENGGAQNVNIFETSVTPKIALGLVYQVIPGKTNINFGVEVNPGAYTWTTTETTNSNINTIYTKKSVDEYGNTTTSKKVALAANNAETRQDKFNNAGTTTQFNIGATWFFTENAKLDVFYRNRFDNIFATTNTFGVDFSVLF